MSLWRKAEFSASFLQSSVSHDPSEIFLICWFEAQETFLIIISVEMLIPCWIKVFISSQKNRTDLESLNGSVHWVAIFNLK